MSFHTARVNHVAFAISAVCRLLLQQRRKSGRYQRSHLCQYQKLSHDLSFGAAPHLAMLPLCARHRICVHELESWTFCDEIENGMAECCRRTTRCIMIEIRKHDFLGARHAPADPFIDQLVIRVRVLSPCDECRLGHGLQRLACDGRRRWRTEQERSGSSVVE